MIPLHDVDVPWSDAQPMLMATHPNPLVLQPAMNNTHSASVDAVTLSVHCLNLHDPITLSVAVLFQQPPS